MLTLMLLLTMAFPPHAEVCTPIDPATVIWTTQGYSIAIGDGHVLVLHQDVKSTDKVSHVCIPQSRGHLRLYLQRKDWVIRAHQKLASDAWVDKSISKTGERCCDAGKDCHKVPAERVMSHRDGVILPDYNNAVIPGDQIMPSEDGRYWVCIWGGKVRCFFAPYSGS